ncbi:MAG: hypothetical protein GY719_17575 [bacterium]|nr:hypothetical protein [bacterium]
MKRPNKAAAIAVLEVVATESPEQLDWLCSTLAQSQARADLRQLAAEQLGGVDVDQIAGVVRKAERDLGVLRSRIRRHWRHPRELVEAPNVAALHTLASARARRSPGGSPARRAWLRLAQRLLRAHHADRRCRRLLDFLNERSAPGTGARALESYLPVRSRLKRHPRRGALL